MNAAIYARKSTEQTGVADEQKSVARQVEHATAYATRKGWTVADEHVYVDDGISGAEFKNRPGFLRLMNALKPRPPFQVLVMSEESRLGREAIETAYAMKLLVTAGVRVFFYLEDRERTLDTPIEKIMLSLTAFADELEREKARQRTYDAMLRKARAGHVTGGKVFGYENVRLNSHVERRVLEDEAAIVREIFELYASGLGVRTIAKQLNDARRPCPRSRPGRPRGWAPSSVWEILHRPAYRGEMVWNQSTKRDRWGAQAYQARSEQEWIRVPAPQLRIIPEPLWQAAQARAEGARASYIKATHGEAWGRPSNAHESKYLLTGFTRCNQCGSNFVVRSRSHGRRRSYWYVCSAFHHRGRAVCGNSLEMRIESVDDAILTEAERFVLHPKVVKRAFELALAELTEPHSSHAGERDRLEDELRLVERELANLTRALAAGGDLTTLVDATRATERRRNDLRTECEAWDHAAAVFTTTTVGEYEARIAEKLTTWRAVLRQEAQDARQVLRQLLPDRVTLTPTERDGTRVYGYQGRFSLGGLFEGIVCPQMLVRPTGFERLWTIERKGLIAA